MINCEKMLQYRHCVPAGLDAQSPVDRRLQTRKGRRRIGAVGLLVAIAPLWNGGCTPVQAVIPIADTANYLAEEQFITDKWISQWYGKQCSLANFLEDRVMCRDAPPDKIVAPIYCYSTLGKPECFESPDPFDPRRPLLGGLPQQRRQAERYQQYLNTGTRWPLKPIGQAETALPAAKSNPINNDTMQNNNPRTNNRVPVLKNDLPDNTIESDSVPASQPAKRPQNDS